MAKPEVYCINDYPYKAYYKLNSNGGYNRFLVLSRGIHIHSKYSIKCDRIPTSLSYAALSTRERRVKTYSITRHKLQDVLEEYFVDLL